MWYGRHEEWVKMTTGNIPAVHPGEVLYEDWLLPKGRSQSQLAKAMRVPPSRIYQISCRENIVTTTETALRMEQAFVTSPEIS